MTFWPWDEPKDLLTDPNERTQVSEQLTVFYNIFPVWLLKNVSNGCRNWNDYSPAEIWFVLLGECSDPPLSSEIETEWTSFTPSDFVIHHGGRCTPPAAVRSEYDFDGQFLWRQHQFHGSKEEQWWDIYGTEFFLLLMWDVVKMRNRWDRQNQSNTLTLKCWTCLLWVRNLLRLCIMSK